MDYEQLDIFYLLSQEKKKEKYCFDDDINEIHEKLIEVANKYRISIGTDEFTIWSHVPQYGYRLWLDMKVTKENLENKDFQIDIDRIIDFAKERNIELSCMVGACFFYREEDTASLPFSTTFMDKARRKIK